MPPDFTGQRQDGTGLLHYGARSYDPALGRFASADSVVPGAASGAGGAAASLGPDAGAALRPLAVDFHEPGLVAGVAQENAFTQARGFAFQLGARDRQQAKVGHGPANPQALNRYTYVLNNPLRYIDPTGHATNNSTVVNESSRPVVIRGEKAREEQYRRPGCVGDSYSCFYWEEVLLPGASSTELGFIDVDSVRALDGEALDGMGAEWEFKIYANSHIVIRDFHGRGPKIFTNGLFGCLIPWCGFWEPTRGGKTPEPDPLSPPCQDLFCRDPY